MSSNAGDSNLQSILIALQKLSPADWQTIINALQSGSDNQLEKPADGIADWQSEIRLSGLAEGIIELYSRTVRKLLKQYPIPTSSEVRAYLSERMKVVSPDREAENQRFRTRIPCPGFQAILPDREKKLLLLDRGGKGDYYLS